MQHHECGVEMIRRDFLTGRWAPYLEKALNITPSYDEPLNGGEVYHFVVSSSCPQPYTTCIAAFKNSSHIRWLQKFLKMQLWETSIL